MRKMQKMLSHGVLVHAGKQHVLSPPFSRDESLHDADIEGYEYTQYSTHLLLPALWSPRRRVLARPEDNIAAYLAADLDTSRLNAVHAHLWIAGQKGNISPLHRSLQFGRRPVLTEQTDLHLTWDGQDLYLKPLPRYLCSHSFWRHYLCHDEAMYARALGLLRTYIWLIRSELDYDAAVEHKLIRCESWTRWRSFGQSVLSSIRPDTPIDQRYQYGELRLGRVNLIYRIHPFLGPGSGRGFYNRYKTYGSFFERNFLWTVTVFLYLSIILTAMQVGSTTPPLQNNEIWLQALYGFSAFCVILPLAVVAVALSMFVLMFLSNLSYTLFHTDP